MNQNQNKSVFITVGTTEFEELIQAFDNLKIYEIFSHHGYNKFVFQLGRGKYKPINFGKFDVTSFDLKPTLSQNYRDADIIISHCGAGTLLECLQLQKKICVVVNDTLMNNHQTELFDVLKEQNYIQGVESVSKFQEEIKQIVQKLDSGLNKYPKPQPNSIETIIQQTVF